MTNYTAYPTDTDPVATLVWMSTNLEWLMSGVLFFIFISFALGNYMYRDRKTGKGNLPESLAISSFITTGGAIILYFIPGLLSLATVINCLTFMIIFMIWYMFSNKE